MLWKRLNHPNITPFIGVDEKSFTFAVVCSWMPNGNIVAYLKDSPGANRPELVSTVSHDHDVQTQPSAYLVELSS